MKWLTLATLVAAAGSFAILFLSAWGLSTDVNIQFVAYWGLFFAMTGVLGGLMQETTRAVGSSLGPASGRMAAPGPSLDDVPASPPAVVKPGPADFVGPAPAAMPSSKATVSSARWP